jgi:hypothetical protein
MYLSDYFQQQNRGEIQWGEEERPNDQRHSPRRYSNSISSDGSNRNPITTRDGTIIHRKPGPYNQGSRMIGMDGAIMTSPTSMQSMKPIARTPPSQFSVFDENTWGESSNDDTKFEVVLMPEDKRRKRLVGLLYCSGCLLLVLVVFLAPYFGTQNNEPTQVSSFSTMEQQLPNCQSGNVGPKDLHEPKLQIIITGLSIAPDDEEKEKLEGAIAQGYNEQAGGCLDGT